MQFLKPFFVLTCFFMPLAPAIAAPTCTSGHDYAAADFSAPITDLGARGDLSAARELQRMGVQTIIRYYDHTDETIPCKTLVPEETDFLIENGFSIAVIFQHNNDNPMTFLEGLRGAADAQRSLELAGANGQPAGSTIYFGVDGIDEAIKGANYQYYLSKGEALTAEQEKTLEATMGRGNFNKHRDFYDVFRTRHGDFFASDPGKTSPEEILPYLDDYFLDIRIAFDDARARDGTQGYDVGGYGSGLVCAYLLENELVDRCWLAQSRGWPGYTSFEASNQWSLSQQLVTKCTDWKRRSGGQVELDFNAVNPNNADFGQWNYISARTPAFSRPIKKDGVTCYAY